MTQDIKQILEHLTQQPGIYRMLDDKGDVLYVGKATNLKKRVTSYFTQTNLSTKTRALVKQIANIEVSVTRSETEALLLESTLIKALRPKYNVLMRDDKSYPFIIVTAHSYPKMDVMRSKHKPKTGSYYGPYPSMLAAREALNLIQKVFQIRNCQDSYFNARTRPCLQYQIKRCTAPCVDYISKTDYLQSIKDAEAFLQGKSQHILESLARRMDAASTAMAFEEAALIRDQIKHLRQAQEQQGMSHHKGDVDVIAIDARPGFACLQWVVVRHGEVKSSQHFFPTMPLVDFDLHEQALLSHVFMAFVTHFYLEFPERIPALILTNALLEDREIVMAMLSQLRGKSCKIQTQTRGIKTKWLDFAMNNLALSIQTHRTAAETLNHRYLTLETCLGLKQPITRMECFDISHTQGQDTVASCVVFDKEGPCRQAYRRFNITGITPGDDYAAMYQALTRRFKRLLEAQSLPELLLIDGGKGQVQKAREVLEALGIRTVFLLGIAKGVSRKAGLEHLVRGDTGETFILPESSEALHLLQHIRDEAHRFAITSHRQRRQKTSKDSTLLSIEGIGPARRKALLQRFGGLRELAKAPVDEIAKVKGISPSLAQVIYAHFHP